MQQLQDSSTLESQALSTSFHQQNLLPVPSADSMSVVSVSAGHLSSLSTHFCSSLSFRMCLLGRAGPVFITEMVLSPVKT